MDNEYPKNIQNNSYALPIAIIIAAVFVSGAIFYSRGGFSFLEIEKTSDSEQNNDIGSNSLNEVRLVGANDHIFGDINAPVKIIEYSDFECPFCKSFHHTMKQIMDEYKDRGKVMWVYRHFPIDELHPVKARKEAAASECAAELGGNDAFWKYADKVFETTPSNNQIDLAVLPELAEKIGLNKSEFDACLGSGKFDKRVQDDYENAVETGGNGTPWTIIVAPNGKKFPINGAQSYFTVKSIIDAATRETSK